MAVNVALLDGNQVVLEPPEVATINLRVFQVRDSSGEHRHIAAVPLDFPEFLMVHH